MSASYQDLKQFNNADYHRGASCWKEWMWRYVSMVFFQSPLIWPYAWKRRLLLWFGAKLGKSVVLKPRVTITMPWKLHVGDCVWIGENVWLDTLHNIYLGNHVVISQGAYLCTGNHDYRRVDFALRLGAIHIEDEAWVGAQAVVGPGVSVGRGAVLGLASVATQDLAAGKIYVGHPAQEKGIR